MQRSLETRISRKKVPINSLKTELIGPTSFSKQNDRSVEMFSRERGIARNGVYGRTELSCYLVYFPNVSWCRRWRIRRSSWACRWFGDERRICLHRATKNRRPIRRPKWRETRPFRPRRRRRFRRHCRLRCRRRRRPERKSTSRCLRCRPNASWCGGGGRSCAGKPSCTTCTRTASSPCGWGDASWGWIAGWSCGHRRGTCAATPPSAECGGRPTSATGRNLCRNRRIWTASPSSECNCWNKNRTVSWLSFSKRFDQVVGIKCLPVIAEMILTAEGFAANVARVGPLVRVRPLVDEQIVGFGELAVAELADELLLGAGSAAGPAE